MILREARGEVSASAFRVFLRERDTRLNLEYDVSWVNQFVIGHLLHLFPSARFIVLVRDSYTWLQSAVGHLISREMPSEILDFLPWWIKPERYPHSRHDRALAQRGLYSIPAFLHAWNDHVDRCTGPIPEDRRLVIRTHELARSHGAVGGLPGNPCGFARRGQRASEPQHLAGPARVPRRSGLYRRNGPVNLRRQHGPVFSRSQMRSGCARAMVSIAARSHNMFGIRKPEYVSASLEVTEVSITTEESVNRFVYQLESMN